MYQNKPAGLFDCVRYAFWAKTACSQKNKLVELQVSVLPLLTILLSCSNRDSSKRDLNLRRLKDR